MDRRARRTPGCALALVLALTTCGLAACGDDPVAATSDASDGSGEVAEDATTATDTAVVDAPPANAEQLYARLKGQLVNGRTTVIAAPDAALEVTFDYTVWSPPSCAECAVQILVATSDGSRVACAYDAAPGVYPGVRGHASVAMTAPSAPGTYGFRWQLLQVESCEAAIAGYPDAPADAAQTLFEILVQ